MIYRDSKIVSDSVAYWHERRGMRPDMRIHYSDISHCVELDQVMDLIVKEQTS